VALTELSLPSVNAGLLEVGVAPPPAPDAPVPVRLLPQEQDVLTLAGVIRMDRGRVESALSRVIVALESAPYFEQVALVRSEETDKGLASFQLRCRVRQGLRPDGVAKVVASR
jgi:hypothetical protein